MAKITIEIEDKELIKYLETFKNSVEKDKAEALRRYAYLRDDGYIDENEYAKKKIELMNAK